MIKEILKTDREQFRKTKKINAKRPGEYWLLFFKQYILKKRGFKFKLFYLLALVPIGLIFLYFTGVVASEGMIVFAFITGFFFLFSLPFVAMYAKKDFIPINAFAELAKFIVYAKGDLYKNGIKIRLNAGGIETDQNLLKPEDIGFTNGSGYTYKPYQLERFFGQFHFRDGTFCMVSMLQISLRVRSTKRRSSGKTKTKIKHKHKFFYQLILKVKASDYDVLEQNATGMYDTTVKSEGDYILIKVKSKEKVDVISSKISKETLQNDSIYTRMLKYIKEYNVLVPKNGSTITNLNSGL